jgi:hypothetical protein
MAPAFTLKSEIPACPDASLKGYKAARAISTN